jgi:glycosyltransferase involved in cell wall biosynthesis
MSKIIALTMAVQDEGPDLEQMLDSYLCFTTRPQILIVVDDGSKDPVLPRLRPYWREFAQVRHVRHETPIGAGPAKHRASEMVRPGEMMVMTDAHCIVPPNWAEQMLARDEDGEPRVYAWPIDSFTGVAPRYYGIGIENLALRFGPRTSTDGRCWGPLGGMLAMRWQTMRMLGGYCPHLVGFGCEEPWLAMRMAVSCIPCEMMEVPIRHRYVEEAPHRQIDPQRGNSSSQVINIFLMIQAAYPNYFERYVELMRPECESRFGAAATKLAIDTARTTDAQRWHAFFGFGNADLPGYRHPWTP